MTYTSYDINAREQEKMHTLDRIIVLKPMEGKKVLSSTGNVDNRLFTGENRLHAIYDINTGFWYLRYDVGTLPETLDVKFSEMTPLLDFIRNYFMKRNVEIVEVIG